MTRLLLTHLVLAAPWLKANCATYLCSEQLVVASQVQCCLGFSTELKLNTSLPDCPDKFKWNDYASIMRFSSWQKQFRTLANVRLSQPVIWPLCCPAGDFTITTIATLFWWVAFIWIGFSFQPFLVFNASLWLFCCLWPIYTILS